MPEFTIWGLSVEGVLPTRTWWGAAVNLIEQDVDRVDHTLSADDLTATGRDVECVVLARAVRWHVEHRVLINGHKTVVFR